jgi:hypothetical protein
MLFLQHTYGTGSLCVGVQKLYSLLQDMITDGMCDPLAVKHTKDYER